MTAVLTLLRLQLGLAIDGIKTLNFPVRRARFPYGVRAALTA
jgi:hypothetical protein